MTNYFNDYYLKPGMNGYIDPKELKTELMKKDGLRLEPDAEKMAITQALALNRIRAQRNMGFSDDGTTRKELASIYQKIAHGDGPTIAKYKDNIASIRRDAEIDERLAMETLLKPSLNPTTTRERIAKEVPLAAVDLVNDIKAEQQKDIQITINSYAIALVFGEKQATVAEKDRTHKLDVQLDSYDKDVAAYEPDGENAGFSNRPLLAKLQELKGTDREKLKVKFEKTNKESPVMKLPAEQKTHSPCNSG